MFAARDIVVAAFITGLLAAGGMWIWPWARIRGRFVISGMATSAGFMAWNFTLNHTNAVGFDKDAPYVFVSWQDAGTGILVFTTAALILGLITERREPAQRVVGAATIVGLIALVYDVFFF
jgi:hypothetical protein